MKINFTKKDYRVLVTMLEIADWVITSHDNKDRKETEKYRKLRNDILSHHKAMGMEESYQEINGKYYETLEYEQNSDQAKLIQAYDDNTFLAELVARLSDRDHFETYGENDVDRLKHLTEIEEAYANEVNNHGISNIGIIKKKTLH